jgi:hypothetical protein
MAQELAESMENAIFLSIKIPLEDVLDAITNPLHAA